MKAIGFVLCVAAVLACGGADAGDLNVRTAIRGDSTERKVAVAAAVTEAEAPAKAELKEALAGSTVTETISETEILKAFPDREQQRVIRVLAALAGIHLAEKEASDDVSIGVKSLSVKP